MNKIKDLRSKINEIDKKLLDLIIERLQVVREIGREKSKKGIGIIDKNREQEIFKKLIGQAEKQEIDPEIIRKIWKMLMKLSYEIEASSELDQGAVGEGGKNGNS
ncbi:MAG TPA: chorismate mutase [Patescibacteria group bacterium]|nr:chorismate mutase [Patescibacteria group bacterium]